MKYLKKYNEASVIPGEVEDIFNIARDLEIPTNIITRSRHGWYKQYNGLGIIGYTTKLDHGASILTTVRKENIPDINKQEFIEICKDIYRRLDNEGFVRTARERDNKNSEINSSICLSRHKHKFFYKDNNGNINIDVTENDDISYAKFEMIL